MWKQVRVADPTFLGYFIDKGVSAAAKVVRKVNSFVFCFFQKHSTLFTFNIEFERVGSSYRIWEGRIWFPTPYLLRMPIRGFMILLLESCLDFTFLLCLPLLVYHNLELSSYNSWVGHYSKRSYRVYVYWYLSTLIVGLSTREGWCVCPSR